MRMLTLRAVTGALSRPAQQASRENGPVFLKSKLQFLIGII